MSAPTVAAPRLAWRQALYPYALLMLANLFWASNWVVGRAVHQAFPPVALSFWRWGVATVIFAPFALPRLKGKWPIIWRHRWLLLILGVTGIATYQSIIYAGLTYTTAVNSSLLNAAGPLVIVLVAWLIDRLVPTPRQFVGMAISLLGAVLIVARGDLATLRGFRFNPGDLVIFAAMPLWSIYTVLLRRRPRELDDLGFMLVAMAIGLAALTPAYVYEAAYIRMPQWSWEIAAAVLYIAVTSSILAYILWNRGVDLVGPNRAAFTQPFQPVFIALLAVTLLGEEFHLYHAVGFAVIFAGWYLTSGIGRRA
jgi:drug/metabolite transporter (DMT)-like permease